MALRLHTLSSLIELRRMLKLVKLRAIMPKDQLRARHLDNTLDHLVRAHPIIMVPRQPALRHILLVVGLDVVLVGREEPGAALRQVEQHARQPRRVAGHVLHGDALGELPRVAVEGLPVEVHVQVLRDVDAEVSLGEDGVEGVFELELVHVDGHVGAFEVSESARVVQVQVAHDDGFDVFDVVAGGFDGRVELVLRFVVHARENVVDGRAPDVWVIGPGAGLEEDKTFGWVLDEGGDDDAFTAGDAWVGVAGCG